MRATVIVLGVCAAAAGAVVIDRIAVVVGKHVIKQSDIERDLRLTEFLNREPLDLGVQAMRKSAERLIDQQLIRTELATGGYQRATDEDANALLQQIQRERFGGSAARLRAELARYELTEGELRQQLLWQLTVLRFIQQRFQPGVSVPDQDVRAYYDQHRADLQRQYPKNSCFAALSARIRSQLEGEAVNRDLDEWLTRARQRAAIEYRQGAFP